MAPHSSTLAWKIPWTEVLEKTLESPLDSKEIQPVHSEGDQLGEGNGNLLQYSCLGNPKESSLAGNSLWGLQKVAYMILYLFHCHSPTSSHPLPLPQSP